VITLSYPEHEGRKVSISWERSGCRRRRRRAWDISPLKILTMSAADCGSGRSFAGIQHGRKDNADTMFKQLLAGQCRMGSHQGPRRGCIAPSLFDESFSTFLEVTTSHSLELFGASTIINSNLHSFELSFITQLTAAMGDPVPPADSSPYPPSTPVSETLAIIGCGISSILAPHGSANSNMPL
jgi:hypothetical protein